MAAILNSDILDSTSSILDSAILVFPLKHTHTCQDWFPSFAQRNLHSFIPTELMAAILNSQTWIHSFFWFTHLVIFSQIDDGPLCHLIQFCHLEFCHLGFSFCIVELRHLVFFSQIHSKTSPSTLTLTQTNSFWLKLIHSHWTWWWQPSWILPTWFQPSCTKNITHNSDLTWWWQPSRILPTWIQPLPSWIQTRCYLVSDSFKNTPFHSDSDSN